MKQADILKILSRDLGTSDVHELNTLLKAKNAPTTKYRLTGKKLGHLGYTTMIKNITAEGLKIYNVNKVTLIKFADIESFEKAKPKVARAPVVKAIESKKEVKKATSQVRDADDDDDDEIPLDVYGHPMKPEKFRPKKPTGKSGSSFIPVPGKKKTK